MLRQPPICPMLIPEETLFPFNTDSRPGFRDNSRLSCVAFDGIRPVANAEAALTECRIMAGNAGKANGCIGRSSATTGQYVCVCMCVGH